jgi:hypothetical protein
MPCFAPLVSRLFLIALAFGLIATACSKGSGDTPSTPTPPNTTVSGTWSGTATDSSGDGSMTWALSQSGTSFTGNLTMADRASGVTGRGSVTGTISGSSLQFSISVPSGGFDEPSAACSASVTGTAVASASSISGTYSGSNSCSGGIASGQINLNKQ